MKQREVFGTDDPAAPKSKAFEDMSKRVEAATNAVKAATVKKPQLEYKCRCGVWGTTVCAPTGASREKRR